MKILMGRDRSLLETILALISRSQIGVAWPITDLPAGFTEVDAAVLEWISAEARSISRNHVRH